MMRKYLVYLLLPLLIVCFYLFRTQPQKNVPDHRDSFTETKTSDVDGFNRSVTHIIYSKHARCRMDCRYITEDEVKDILQRGKVNTQKIETDSRGVTYPLEGTTQGHHLRIVFAPKGDDAVEVVTCIDLDKEWPCHCN